MARFRSKHAKAVAEIHLGSSPDAKPDKPTFVTNGAIVGRAVFTLPTKVDITHCKVTLRGTVKINVVDNVSGSWQRNWESKKLDFLGVSLERNARSGLQVENGTVRMPFRFHLRECEKLSDMVSGLPPSLDSDQEGRRLSNGLYSVAYSLTATVFSARGIIASTTEKITVLSVTQEPSLCSSDCPGEYFWAQSIPQHSIRLQKKPLGPRMEAAGQEPDPIVLDAHDTASGGSTKVPFVLKLSPTSTDVLNEKSMPSQCQVSACLVTKTRITPDGLEQLASSIQRGLDKVPSSRSEEVQIHKSHDQEDVVGVSAWSHSKSTLVEPFSVLRFSFLFSIGPGKPPLPSFSTPLLARSYAINVTLSFPSSSLPSMKLLIPLEILYEADDEVCYKIGASNRVNATEIRK